MRGTALDTDERLGSCCEQEIAFPGIAFAMCIRGTYRTPPSMPTLIKRYHTSIKIYMYVRISVFYGKFIEEIFFVVFTLHLRFRNLSSIWVSIHKIILWLIYGFVLWNVVECYIPTEYNNIFKFTVRQMKEIFFFQKLFHLYRKLFIKFY